MCGRYRIKDPEKLTAEMRRRLGVELPSDFAARYIAAPSQMMLVVATSEDQKPVTRTMRWGFVPFWEKSAKPKLCPINAQSEGIADKGMFRQSLQQRRCLVPADGFYEWQRLDEKLKLPFDIHLKSGRPFFMAGIFEREQGNRPATYAVLTTRPNELMAKIHDRMPMILAPTEAIRWLAPGPITEAEIAVLAAPHPADDMEATPISSLVNSPRNDVPEVLEPVAFLPQSPKRRQGELF